MNPLWKAEETGVRCFQVMAAPIDTCRRLQLATQYDFIPIWTLPSDSPTIVLLQFVALYADSGNIHRCTQNIVLFIFYRSPNPMKLTIKIKYIKLVILLPCVGDNNIWSIRLWWILSKAYECTWNISSLPMATSNGFC